MRVKTSKRAPSREQQRENRLRANAKVRWHVESNVSQAAFLITGNGIKIPLRSAMDLAADDSLPTEGYNAVAKFLHDQRALGKVVFLS